MSLVKILRLRKTISTTDVTKTISGGDIKLEIYLETKTENGTPPISYEEWELKFITLDLPADVPLTKKYSNKDSQYGASQKEVLDFIVPDFIQLATLTKLRALSYTQAEAQELSKSYYGLIQDPFSEQAPLTRNYGTDGYFLNNGTEVLVRWNTGASVSIWNSNYVEAEINGVNYSLADGSESWDQSLSLPGSTPSTPFIQTPEDIQFAKEEKKKIFKYVFAYNGTRAYMLSSGQIKLFEKPNEPDFFPGEVKDLDLVTKLVDLWKTKIPNYDLKISNPNNQAGGSLEFKDPLQGLSASTAVADNTGSSVSTADEVKFELSIVYDKNVVIKADQDLPNIEIYVGEPPALGEFLFDEDEFDDSALLDEEYLEVDFRGDSKTPDWLEQGGSGDDANGIDVDNELDKSPPTDVNNLPIGNSPGEGSKIKKGGSLINLAGHRLKNIPGDLQTYLRANGYPGIIIGSLGIMRNLKESIDDPHKQGRVAASYHGVGLAHDIAFGIDSEYIFSKPAGTKGKKGPVNYNGVDVVWKGIGDNKNLAKCPEFTKLLWKWTQLQGDLTWGAEWGDSDPSTGEIKGWGITEYHHWQIKESLQAAYWEPVKGELARLGFRPNQMQKNGKDSNLHKLMIALK